MDMKTKLARITEISITRPEEKFTSIYHLINKDLLMICHNELEKNKAVGVDGVTKAEYASNLQENLDNLVTRLKNKGYRPTEAKRVYIPKANGKLRGIAIAIYEDKIVQLALAKLISAIFEPHLSDTMYGFRPKRNCHDAIRNLTGTIQMKKVNYIVDADIKGFFDNVDHEWLIECIKQRIADPNVIRLIKKFLKVGIMEKGNIVRSIMGTPQGSILSPVLANIYMHYVLALWFKKEIKEKARGECYIVIYADDYICCFQYKEEAEYFYNKLLPARLKKFNLELEPNKTRLIEFGRFAEENAKAKKKKVETFDFLGFTFYCGRNAQGKFKVKIKTSRKKYISKIKAFKVWIKENRNKNLLYIINMVNLKLRGHFNYFGFYDNFGMINKYRYQIIVNLFKWLNRRSQKKSYTWQEFNEVILTKHPIMKARVCAKLY